MRTFQAFALAALGAGACTGTGSGSDVLGTTDHRIGAFHMTNPDQTSALSGFVFENIGTGTASISNIEVMLADGEVIPGVAGIGVEPGNATTYLFDTATVREVDYVTFELSGAGADLVVTGTQATGTVPSHQP